MTMLLISKQQISKDDDRKLEGRALLKFDEARVIDWLSAVPT
jgi:hypothetical protein